MLRESPLLNAWKACQTFLPLGISFFAPFLWLYCGGEKAEQIGAKTKLSLAFSQGTARPIDLPAKLFFWAKSNYPDREKSASLQTYLLCYVLGLYRCGHHCNKLHLHKPLGLFWTWLLRGALNNKFAPGRLMTKFFPEIEARPKLPVHTFNSENILAGPLRGTESRKIPAIWAPFLIAISFDLSVTSLWYFYGIILG